jgi:hypothetical protein
MKKVSYFNLSAALFSEMRSATHDLLSALLTGESIDHQIGHVDEPFVHDGKGPHSQQLVHQGGINISRSPIVANANACPGTPAPTPVPRERPLGEQIVLCWLRLYEAFLEEMEHVSNTVHDVPVPPGKQRSASSREGLRGSP